MVWKEKLEKQEFMFLPGIVLELYWKSVQCREMGVVESSDSTHMQK